MLNLNFIPEDYIQNHESRRTNFIYLVLFVVVMVLLVGTFGTIKVRQQLLEAEAEVVSEKMAEAKESLKQFEELQQKQKAILKTAMTTVELLEPVPRSVLLASLTNNLPGGVSLLQLKIVQKAPKKSKKSVQPKSSSKYDKAKNKKSKTGDQEKVSPERLLETHINIGGVAPSDLQLAAYIRQLSESSLLDNVALVESKEYKMDDSIFRQFKLTAMLRKDISLSDEDIKKVRAVRGRIAHSF